MVTESTTDIMTAHHMEQNLSRIRDWSGEIGESRTFGLDEASVRLVDRTLRDTQEHSTTLHQGLVRADGDLESAKRGRGANLDEIGRQARDVDELGHASNNLQRDLRQVRADLSATHLASTPDSFKAKAAELNESLSRAHRHAAYLSAELPKLVDRMEDRPVVPTRPGISSMPDLSAPVHRPATAPASHPTVQAPAI